MKHAELDKLERWLREHDWPYDRKIRPRGKVGKYDAYDMNQIVVYRPFPRDNEILFDAICNRGSYGYEQGLLEIMGEIVGESNIETDTVAGYLTAEQVIERFKKWLEKGYEESSN